jgi:hypothetical protein
VFDGKSSESGVSSFQALSMSLAGRVGTGNIAGVATAIALEDPSSILDVDGCFFWSKYCCRSYLLKFIKRNIWVNFEVDLLFISRED